MCEICDDNECSVSFGGRIITNTNIINYGLARSVCETLLDNMCIRFGTKVYRQIVDIPVGTNCVPFVADFVLFCFERNVMKSLSQKNHAGIIEVFESTSRYLDD